MYFMMKLREVMDKFIHKSNYDVLQRQNVSLHMQAKILNELRKDKEITSIRDVEYKVYSQNGEDGVIQWLVSKLPIQNKTFIEFGVENYSESNTRFLLEENNWSGMIIDGSRENIEYVKKQDIYWHYDLKAIDEFITRENINELLESSGFDYDLGLLSIDIDGNDYWVLKEINKYNPRILIVEYNPIYGNESKVTTIYKSDFVRTQEHYSNLHFGASLQAMKSLCGEKGYTFVGVNSTACNAFFVRNDLIKYLPNAVLEDNEFVQYKLRQARDIDGHLLYLSSTEERELINEMLLYDIENEKQIKVKEIK